MDSEQARRKVDEVGFWWHSIDFGNGIVSPGHKSAQRLAAEFQSLQLHDLKGKTVLDVGAWDGYFSFRCEQLGAARVVALDHYVWSMDLPKQRAYYTECAKGGVVPEPYEQRPDLWDPVGLPGKRGFDTAKEILGSAVTPVVGDLMDIDLQSLGSFDVVLFLGVLYHLKDPFLGLRRLAEVCRHTAIIETQAIHVPLLGDRSICEFYEANELAADVSNWWAPNADAVCGMCRAAGFKEARALVAPPRRRSLRRRINAVFGRGYAPIHYRLVVQARK
jgi:tRNA (mo5U34)-methyltransferase